MDQSNYAFVLLLFGLNNAMSNAIISNATASQHVFLLLQYFRSFLHYGALWYLFLLFLSDLKTCVASDITQICRLFVFGDVEEDKKFEKISLPSLMVLSGYFEGTRMILMLIINSQEILFFRCASIS